MGRAFNGDAVDAVRMGNDIEDVVSGYVKLEKKGKKLFGLCPFHAEKTPSFSVDAGKQLYYCFSCNKGGDVFKFVQDIERVDFPEALRRLAARARVALPEDGAADPGHARRKAERERIVAMNGAAARVFAEALGGQRGRAAREYLKRRAVPPEAANRFGLGFAPPERAALHDALLAEGYTQEELLLGGLVSVGKNGSVYDRFRNRLMFPIADVAGRVVGFGGRAIGDDEPKYLNSPETPVFTKGRVLYGLDLAKSTREGRMYIVEGYMDCIALSANGVGNAVASLGTALTEEQGKLLRRFADEAVIAFDADAAGKAAALRGLDILDGLGIGVKVLRLPAGKDPDEFIRNFGPTAFAGLLGGARTLVEYKLDMAREANPGDDMDSRVRFLRDAVQTLAGLGSAVEREMYAKAVAAQHGVSEQAILEEVRAAQRAGAGKTRRAPAVRPPDGPPAGTPARQAQGAGQGEGGRQAQGAGQGEGGRQAQGAGQGEGGRQAEPRRRHPEGFGDELFVLALLSVDNTLWDIVGQAMPPEKFENADAARAAAYAAGMLASGNPVGACDLMPFFEAADADLFAATLARECHPEDTRRAMAQKIVDIEFARCMRDFREACVEYDCGDNADVGRAAMECRLAAQREGIRRGRLFRPARYG